MADCLTDAQFSAPPARATCAIAIRDHVLPLLRAHATIRPISGVGSAAWWEVNCFQFVLTTPFSDFPDRPAARSYDEARLLQQSRKSFPYRLDVWHGKKVMSVEWTEDGRFRLISFWPGIWQAEALGILVDNYLRRD